MSYARRRLVVHPQHTAYVAGYARAVRDLRGELYAQSFETLTELKVLRREFVELRQAHDAAVQAMREMQAAALARAQAHDTLVGLYRERAIQRAHAAERDPALPLQ
jgi:hypothetical protein